MGIFSFNNIAEFKPIEIGQMQPQPYENDSLHFEHYYPLNMLALSKSNYETFIEGDHSVFSKKIIVLDMSSFKQLYSTTMNNTDSKLSMNYEDGITYPKNKTIDYYYNNNTENKLLEFVKKGGTLVITNIFNPDSMYFPNQTIFQNTELGELFPFQAGDEIEFDRIGQNIVRDLPNKTKKLEAPATALPEYFWGGTRYKNKKCNFIVFRLQSNLFIICMVTMKLLHLHLKKNMEPER